MPTPKILAVVFDLDHTLFDRYATLRETAHDLFLEMRERFAPDITEEEVARVMIEADGKYIIQGWNAVYSCWKERGILADDGGTPESRKEIYEFIWNRCFLNRAVKYPFAIPTLDKLHAMGLKLGLLTNAQGEEGIIRQKAKLELLGMTDKFDEILISGEVGVEKPDRRIFDIMSERMGIPAENMLYVGDNPKNDVFGSKNAGYVPVWVRLREEYGETADCEYSVRDVSEVPGMVEGMNE